MSDKEDKTDQQQQPADQESRRARSVPRPNMGVFSGERGLSRAVPAMPVQPTSSVCYHRVSRSTDVVSMILALG